MPEAERLGGRSDWIDVECLERERTPHEIIETGILRYLTVLSLPDTKQNI